MDIKQIGRAHILILANQIGDLQVLLGAISAAAHSSFSLDRN
ncbi:DUF2783 domain-containing protein [Yoonia sp. BS5-3]|uniref:DUF2783 domain-containing protein n=1 Tax=Yoonia phaeophyticola TaxID=3137369 RepID=A0ABZ3IDU5_9RHOB